MSKTLRKLMLEELGLPDTQESYDKADSAVDVVFDWLDRCERKDELNMAPGWRQRSEMNRREENATGRGAGT